jgi:hypothetical protein
MLERAHVGLIFAVAETYKIAAGVEADTDGARTRMGTAAVIAVAATTQACRAARKETIGSFTDI